MFDMMSGPQQAKTEPEPTPAPELNDPNANPVADDMPQLTNLKAKFERASKQTGVPVEIMAGVASRESHVGKALDQYGFDPAKKTAFGIMQVDRRYHKLIGTHDKHGHPTPASQEHINQAASILKANKELIDKRYPNWTEDQRWRAAAAGYNMGPGNVRTLEHMDEGTTGGDYSQDVMSRAQAYKLLKEKKQ